MFQDAIKKGTLWLQAQQQKLAEFRESIAAKVAQYSRPQKLYAFAAILVLLFPDSLFFGVIVAFCALIMECLPIVHYIWRTLIGKALILLVYAVIANFALANAASVVNHITGVSSTYFTYGHNFAILLYIPTWIAAITILGLLFFQVISICYVSIFIFVLKPLRIANKITISKYPRPATTMVLRTALTLIIILYLQSLSDNKLLSETKILDIYDTEQTTKQLNDTAGATTTKNKDITFNELISEMEFEDVGNEAMFLNNVVKTLAARNLTDTPVIEQLVAHFIYTFDSDGRTRCQLNENSHGVVLNDYEVLEITPDDSQALKYRYQVKTCISPAFPASYYRGD